MKENEDMICEHCGTEHKDGRGSIENLIDCRDALKSQLAQETKAREYLATQWLESEQRRITQEHTERAFNNTLRADIARLRETLLESEQRRITQEHTERAFNNALRADIARLRETLRNCCIDEDNPDTCAVCHEHFNECEIDTVCDDIEDGKQINERPACPGARARLALTAHDVAAYEATRDEDLTAASKVTK